MIVRCVANSCTSGLFLCDRLRHGLFQLSRQITSYGMIEADDHWRAKVTVQRTIRIVEAVIQLSSNNGDLISCSEYFADTVPQSLLNDYHRVESLDDGGTPDAFMHIVDSPNGPLVVSVDEAYAVAQGDFTRLEDEIGDRRFALFGTQGFLYRFVLATLERRYGIVSFHAGSIYDSETNLLTILMGSSGAGKTPLLLSGILRDYRVFSTELTHFRILSDQVIFYKGGLLDNIRLGSLLYEFPEVIERLGLRLPEESYPWEVKVSVDFGKYQASVDKLVNPRVRVIVPRIEMGRTPLYISRVAGRGAVSKLLFENASEKIAASFLLYGRLAVCGLDTPGLTRQRLGIVQQLIDLAGLVDVQTVLASPNNCAGVL